MDLERESLLPLNHTSSSSSSSSNKLRNGLLITLGVATAIGIGIGISTVGSHHQSQASTITSSSSSSGGEKWTSVASMVRGFMNQSVDPCDDFFEYSCGGWLANTPIRADRASVELTASVIADTNYEILKSVAEENWPVIGTMFENCLNVTEVDQAGITAFDNLVIQKLAVNDVWKSIGSLFVQQVTGFLSVNIVVDSKDPSNYAVNIAQDGLTLSQKIFYNDDASVAELKKYFVNVLGLYENVHGDKLESRVDAVVNFEKAIADIWIPLSILRDPVATYNKFSYDSLKSEFSSINWDSVFSNVLTSEQLNSVSFLIDSPKYLQDLEKLILKTDPSAVLDYLKLRAISSFAPFLSSEFVTAHFNFFNKFLNGIEQMPTREKKCVNILDSLLGDILGRYFVERAFPGESKNVSKFIIESLKTTFGKNLPTVSWMDDETRSAAFVKLGQIVDLIGYPDIWTDYGSLYIQPHQFFENVLYSTQFSVLQTVGRLGTKVRKDIWQMTAPTVNAYYDPTLNTINFPAGIIQPTLFSLDYPMAINYGGFGATAGHELSHGFDDQGRQYDGTGKLTTWWTNSSVENFKVRAQCYIDQYSGYSVLGTHLHGDQTLGENIADNSGLKSAFYAYKDWVAANGEEARLLPELTNDQLFFLAYGQSWCAKSKDEYAKRLIEIDVHAPPKFRVIGPVQNSIEFADAFKCPKGSNMNPEKKCTLW